jgi:hypothetical protein
MFTHRTNDLLARGATLVLFCASLFLSGCKKDATEEPAPTAPPVNESELITTLRVTFYTLSFAEYKYMVFTDLDGDGGNAPVITADTLSADSIYNVTIQVLNESVSPAADITAEILAEGTAHQFFYQVTGADLILSYGDADSNGHPIGLEAACFAGAPSAGTLKVTLRHQPDKTAAGVEAGDITNAGGDTDIEVIFPTVVD